MLALHLFVVQGGSVRAGDRVSIGCDEHFKITAVVSLLMHQNLFEHKCFPLMLAAEFLNSAKLETSTELTNSMCACYSK